MPDVDGLAAGGLRYSSDLEPGLRRLRCGRGFRYVTAGGRAVRDAATLARIRRLAIPPAYEDVWICADPRGHLQATARDARGRKQYRYHAQWRRTRDDGKFERLYDFGRRLPRLRRQLRKDLRRSGLPREKVLAAVVSLLDRTLIRIGNAEYARQNDSYGLTTLRDRHVTFRRRGRARFRFQGKGGQAHEIEVDDARLARIVRHCQALPGQQLFQYLDEDGTRQTVDSGLVNDYLRSLLGDGFTAKDFRTWGGTLRAIARMSCTPLPESPSERALAACIAATVKQVARDLRNTPAVCRSSYIHPAVFEAWRQGHFAAEAPAGGSDLRKTERYALAFLRLQRAKGRSAQRR